MDSKLYLVGAGPGDPDLITVKAVKALRKADVILYDALANEALLDYAREDAIKIFVGKRYGCHALSQQEINYLIIDYCSRFEHVVRLKGGDPFIFGRAQEEMDAAREHAIEVIIVPGISSALAVPASENIPLTCRGVNESFWVVTGTNRHGELSKDIALAAQSSATVVILMAMSKLASICDIFIGQGKAMTPAAIIQNGTRPDSKMVRGNIGDIAFRAEAAGLENPAIIIFGDVVNLNPGLLKNKVNNQLQSIKLTNEEGKRTLQSSARLYL